MIIHDLRTPIDAIERSLDFAQTMMKTEFNSLTKIVSECFETT